LFGVRTVSCLRIGCKYHKKESRYEIRWYDKDDLLIVFCLECHPKAEVVRFKLSKEEASKGDEYLRRKISSGLNIPEA
jgi:hypothetical protein